MPVAKYNLTIRNPYEIADEAQVSYTESFFQEFQQADGVADAAVAFGGVTTATLFYLKGDQALTYKLNGSATAMALLANKPLFLGGAAITAATISNASGSTANIVVIGCGA
jgi:hypothetical protein